MASAFINCKFYRTVPANNCVSCVTKPICRLILLYRISLTDTSSKKISPVSGVYSLTSNFTSVDLPDPLGPTNAIDSPVCTLNEISSIEFSTAVLCLNTTFWNSSFSTSPNSIGSSGLVSTGFYISKSKFCSDASASLYANIIVPRSCNGTKI